MSASDFSDVFVSYRRKDVDFARVVVEALEEAGKEVWIDWEDIPPGSVDFSDDIKRGLEGADALIAILSPDYLESPYCMMEVGYALELNKRVVPVIWKKIDGLDIPENIGSINWVYFKPHAGHENTFEESMPKVIQALEQDLEHTREHKRILLRALEWRDDNRNHSRLLVGSEIDGAEGWLVQAASKVPAPTQLHRDFITESRRFATKQQNRLLAGMASALVITVILLIAAVFLGIQASEAEAEAKSALSQAQTAQAEADTNREIAREQANLAQAQSLSAQSNLQFANNSPARALLLAKSALEEYPYTVQAERALSDIFRAAPITGDLSLDFLSEQGWLSVEDNGERVQWTSDLRYLIELTLPRREVEILIEAETEDGEDQTILDYVYEYTPENLVIWSSQSFEPIRTLPQSVRDFIILENNNLIIRSSDAAGQTIASVWQIADENPDAEPLFSVGSEVHGIHALDAGRVIVIRSDADDTIHIEIYQVSDGAMLKDIIIPEDNGAAGLRGELNRFLNIYITPNLKYFMWQTDPEAIMQEQTLYRLDLETEEIQDMRASMANIAGNFIFAGGDLLINLETMEPLLGTARTYYSNNNLHLPLTEDGMPHAYWIQTPDNSILSQGRGRDGVTMDVSILDLATGDILLTVDDVSGLEAWSPRGNYVILWRGNQREMYSLETGELAFVLMPPGPELEPAYSWSLDETYVVLERRAVHLSATGELIVNFRVANRVRWRSDDYLMAVYNDESYLYDVARAAQVGIFASASSDAVLNVSQSVQLFDAITTVQLLDTTQSVKLLYPQSSDGRLALDSVEYNDTLNSVLFSGSSFGSTPQELNLNLLRYNPDQGFVQQQLPMTLVEPEGGGNSLPEVPQDASLSPDGTQLAVSLTGYPLGEGGGDGFYEVFGYKPRIAFYDSTTLEEEAALEDLPAVMVNLDWSPDGTKLAASDAVNSVRVWDLSTQEILYTLPASSRRNQFVHWSPNGTYLATGSGKSGGTEADIIIIWNMETGEAVHQLAGHSSWLNQVSWSPDSALLATLAASPDNTLRIWNVESGEQLASYRLSIEPQDVVWAPGSTRVAVTDIRGNVQVVDLESAEIAHNFAMPEAGYITWVNGNLYSLSNGVVREWFLPETPEGWLERINECCVPRNLTTTEQRRFFAGANNESVPTATPNADEGEIITTDITPVPDADAGDDTDTTGDG